MQIEKGSTSSKWTDTSFLRMRRKPDEFQQSSLTAWAKSPCKDMVIYGGLNWDSFSLCVCLSVGTLLSVGLETEHGSRGQRVRLPFLPSSSPRVSIHHARNMKTASSPQRMQCPMDTDPPQEIRRRFGKKYACCAPKVYASLQQPIAWFRALCFIGR